MRKVINTLGFFFFFAQLMAQNATWRTLSLPNTPLSTTIRSIVIEKDTNFYVMTDSSLLRYNGGIWSKLPPPLNINGVFKNLTLDNQGGVWVSVPFKGLFRYYNNGWQRHDTTNILLSVRFFDYINYDSISKLMLFGTDRGVFTYNSVTNTWKDIGLPPDFPVSVFLTNPLTISRTGEWYFFFLDQFYIHKPQIGTWRSKIKIPTNTVIGSFNFDPNNNLLMSNSNGQLLRYDPVTDSWINLSYNAKIGGFVFDKKNVLWSSDFRNGIIRIDSPRVTNYMVNNSPLYSNSSNKIVVGPSNLKYIFGDAALVQILDDALPTTTKEEGSQTTKIISSYNNPIRERLVLHLERNISTQITFQIHDLSGQLLYQNMFDVKQGSVEISMATFASGLYFVTCSDECNTIKETIKVLKY